jgi:hypothetical protein
LLTRAPRPVRSLLAPGSVFYASLDSDTATAADLAGAIGMLHGHQVAQQAQDDLAMGRGLLAAGLWPTPPAAGG